MLGSEIGTVYNRERLMELIRYRDYQSGPLSLVGIVEAWISLVDSFIELKYFHDVAPPALLCHEEPARRIQSPLLGALLAPRWFFMA